MDSEPRQEVFAGTVERVTYHNRKNGFCVLRIKARGHRDLVTVIGHAAAISPGEWVNASGGWENDREHGPQCRARFLRTSAPTSTEGIEKYLGSGMIRGIGPIYAKRMVRLFGKDVFDIIEAAPERLREVEGIGAKRAAKITSAWADQKVIREIMVFLTDHSVGTARAVRIFKTYGIDAIQVMSEKGVRMLLAAPRDGQPKAVAIAVKNVSCHCTRGRCSRGKGRSPSSLRARARPEFVPREEGGQGRCACWRSMFCPLRRRRREALKVELEIGRPRDRRRRVPPHDVSLGPSGPVVPVFRWSQER